MKNRIKEFRARYNLTQYQLSVILDVRRETISLIENEKQEPSLLMAFKISKALKSTINDTFLLGAPK